MQGVLPLSQEKFEVMPVAHRILETVKGPPDWQLGDNLVKFICIEILECIILF